MPKKIDLAAAPTASGTLYPPPFDEPCRQNRLARDIGIPVSRVAEIVRGRRSITTDTALRLGEYFGTGAEFWLNLQTGFDLRMVRATGWETIRKRIRPLQAA